MLEMVACVAMLAGLPNPGTLPAIVYTPIQGQILGEFIPLRPNGYIRVSEAAGRNILAHELTHFVQWKAGLNPRLPPQERQARWVERKTSAWCPERK